MSEKMIMKKATIQICLSRENMELLKLDQNWKREIFTCGLVSRIKSIDDLKYFLALNHIHNVENISGNLVKKIDGSQADSNFEMFIDDHFIPKDEKDVYCVVSSTLNLQKGEHIVKIFPAVYLKNFRPDLFAASGTNNKHQQPVDDKIKTNIKTVLKLFGRGAEKLAQAGIIEKEDIEAVRYLQGLVK
jgi:hypothetical protein